jgi:hypothetical protein
LTTPPAAQRLQEKDRYRKLDIGSRRELPAAMTEQG